jgi:SAM-dependent methyltransferase
MKAVPLYDALAADYDRFVNWEGRLTHELPFFDGLFEGRRVQRVLDVACGTGHHTIALAQRGYQVLGTDLSGAMVELARENATAAGVDVVFAQLGFGEHATLGRTFDAVLCLGNSLPHLLTESALEAALADFATVLRPGGLLVVQNRNFDLVCSEMERFIGLQSHAAEHAEHDEQGEWLFVRFYDFHQETITFNMIRLQRTDGGWTQDVESTELRPIFGRDFHAALEAQSFSDIVLYGGYDSAPFDPSHSGDLIAVAKKS